MLLEAAGAAGTSLKKRQYGAFEGFKGKEHILCPGDLLSQGKAGPIQRIFSPVFSV